jgi:hypothetical protein
LGDVVASSTPLSEIAVAYFLVEPVVILNSSLPQAPWSVFPDQPLDLGRKIYAYADKCNYAYAEIGTLTCPNIIPDFRLTPETYWIMI